MDNSGKNRRPDRLGKMISRPLRKKSARGLGKPYKQAQSKKFTRVGKESRLFHPSAKNFKTSKSDDSSEQKILKYFPKLDDGKNDQMIPGDGSEQNDEQPDPSKKIVEVYSEEQDRYFRQAMQAVKEGIRGEALEIFISNVLSQTEGKELLLACQGPSSYCIQFLLDSCNDLSVFIRFMKAFEVDRAQCCGNKYASHITETLIYHAVKCIQNCPDDMNSKEDDKKAHVSAVTSWLCDLSKFCLQNLKVFLEDNYACYVLRCLIQVLGGRYLNDDTVKSKNAKRWKSGLKQRYLGEEYEQKPKDDIILDEIPKPFISALKKLSKAFQNLSDIKTYCAEARVVPVLCNFIDALKRNIRKKTGVKFAGFLTNLLFEDKDSEGIPLVLLHKSSSYLVPNLFETGDGRNQRFIWHNNIAIHLEMLIQHPVGNFVIQRILDVLICHNQLLIVYPVVVQYFPAVVKSQHFGVFVSLASACLRLRLLEGQIIKDFLQCFGCDGDAEKEKYLVPTLLGFQSLDTFLEKRSSSSPESYMQIVLQGSLLVQNLLKFHKPDKAVRSILSMKPEEIKYLACHMQGCHVLNAFFSAVNVGEKNKANFLVYLLKPILVPLICNRNGSLTLCRMWMLMNLKHKSIVAQALSEQEPNIRFNQCAYIVYKKFGVHYYRSRFTEWKHFLEGPPPKRKLVDNL